MRHFVVVFLVLFGSLGAVQAQPPAGDRELILRFASESAMVFRGRCLSAEETQVFTSGARIPATRYRFEVGDGLKGIQSRTRFTFVQVGSRGGGRADLGRLAGLPTYSPGTEYVLFLLPASRLGVTSPAGAAEGALAITGERLQWLSGGHGVSARILARAAGAAERGAPLAAPAESRPLEYGSLRAWVAGTPP